MDVRTHVFAIGVEKYQDANVKSVKYAENDVTEFVTAWIDLGVDARDTDLLVSANATKTTIKSRLKSFLAHVQSGDRIIFYYAGHGFAENDKVYITAHDTQLNDPRATSIPLAGILKQLRECKSDQVLLFLDSCHSGFAIDDGIRSMFSKFSTSELKSFCAASEFHVGFASCGITESSYSSPMFGHGIWSHSVIQSLRGEANDAFERPGIITGRSLQGFISKDVSLNLRNAFTKKMTQTPCVFGNFTREFIVADLVELLESRRIDAINDVGILKEALLYNEDRGRVRELSGFSRGHREPDNHSSATCSFVERVGQEDVAGLADKIYKQIQSRFSYKRKELKPSKSGASASIQAPDFTVDINLQQDDDDASGYLLTTKVSVLDSAIISDVDFLELFSEYCDTVVFELNKPINIGDKIDEIEDAADFREYLSYDPDATYLNLNLVDVGIKIRVDPYRVSFSMRGRTDLKVLIEGTQSALGLLGGAEIQLLEFSE